jgi:hypothetical protein
MPGITELIAILAKNFTMHYVFAPNFFFLLSLGTISCAREDRDEGQFVL